MFRHQVLFLALSSMLLLTFAYADKTSISSGTHDISTMKDPTDFRNMMSTVAQTIMKHMIGNSTGPLNAVGVMKEYIVRAKNYEKELSETHEKILKKKEIFKELQKNVNQMSSVGSNKEIQQKLADVQATASKGFQKLKEIENMQENVKRAIHESEIEDTKFIAHINKTFLSANSLFLGNGTDTMNAMFSVPALIGDILSSYSSVTTHSRRVSETLEKLEKNCNEADKNINDAVKELQKIESAQKTVLEMKKPQALGVKDAHGTIVKDSTFVPSLLSTFACFAGVMMFTVMSINYL